MLKIQVSRKIPFVILSFVIVITIVTWKNCTKMFSAEHTGNSISAVFMNGMFKENRKTAEYAKQFVPERYKQDNSTVNYRNRNDIHLFRNSTLANDSRLINLIRNYYIEQPSTEPYNLKHPEMLEYSSGQTPLIDSRLDYMEGGFYVECGALDGETCSTSLFLERVRKWNGLLIEADPSNYALLKSKHRKAFTINAGLSITPTPSKVTFKQSYQTGRIVQKSNEQTKRHQTVTIECFPFYSLMLALNRTTIDFFSLDVEGDELKVLQTIPFDKLDIKMLTVEYQHIPGGAHALRSFMENKGYKVVADIRNGWAMADLIFIQKRLMRQSQYVWTN